MNYWNGLSTAAKILLIAGLLMFIDLLLDWQQVSAFGVTAGATGWAGGLGVLTGVFTIALLLWEGAQLAGVTAKLTVPVALISAGLAGGLALFAIIEFFDHSQARHWPAWVGLILAIIIAIGGWLRPQTGAEAPIVRSTPTTPPPAP